MASFKNLSLRNKLILIQAATALIAVLICCFIFVLNDIKTFKDSSFRNKQSIAEIVGVNSAAPLLFNDQDGAKKILSNLKSNTSVLNAAIFDKTGKEFARFNSAGEKAFIFPNPSTVQPDAENFSGDKFIVDYKIFQDNDFLGTVLLRSELTTLKEIIYDDIRTGVLVLFAGLVAAFLISVFLQRTISKRLLSLVVKTKEVAETGNYSTRTEVRGKDEIGILSSGFNNMLDQIEKMQTTLKDTNIELEKRVKKRTTELETSNKELSAKSEELARSNQELEQFAYVASHDLQEPLRTISNFTGLLQKKYPINEDENVDRYFQFIVKAAAKMQNLINDLLELSRIGRNITLVTVDTNKILESVIADMGTSIKESNAKITSSVLPIVTGSEFELKRLFQNLLSNAIKFRKKDADPEIKISVDEEKEEYLFSVKDNGIGIEEEFYNRIFIIFQRLNNAAEYPGTGIGLATCKKIVALHNGRIWVESKVGEGSNFYFTIKKEKF